MRQKLTIINGVEIFADIKENGQVLVPVKPICDAIGVAYQSQQAKLQEHEILSPTITLRVMVAADGKQREMVCLPLEYVYGWIFTINPKNVSPEAHAYVLTYQHECYDALYRHFAGSLKRQIEANEAEIAALRAVNEALETKKQADEAYKTAKKHLDKVRAARLDPIRCFDFDN